jgi:inosine-uridine nucleoside N-ribohydrolase
VVFSSGFKKITMVPLDATHQATISERQCAQLRSLSTRAANAAAELIEFRINASKIDAVDPPPDDSPVHDALWFRRAFGSIGDRSPTRQRRR